MEAYVWWGILQIFLIDLVLSSDNAVVIGMACRNLPLEERSRAIFYGTAGAIGLRVMLTGFATWLLDIPLVKAMGGLLLLWIAYKLLFGQQEETGEVVYSNTVGQAVKTIIAADFVMSLDNVLAVGGAARGNLGLVILGLVLSIPLLMWGSAWVSKLMNRYPLLVQLGGGVLVFTAAEMFLDDPYVWKMVNPFVFNHNWLPAMIAVLAVICGRMRRVS